MAPSQTHNTVPGDNNHNSNTDTNTASAPSMIYNNHKANPSGADYLRDLPGSIPQLFDPSHSVKVIEVAKKYDAPEGQKIERIPEYTTPGGPHTYHCSKIVRSWTQGFFPGMIWLLVERQKLLPGGVSSAYSNDELIARARKWQDSYKYLARPSINHDQGFRFQLAQGKDYELTGNEDSKAVLIEASESLVDRYSDVTGVIRSWDHLPPGLPLEGNDDDHWLVIIDNMMNLDMMYEATRLTGDKRYAAIANSQAEHSAKTHVRPDGTTYHVVDFDPRTGKVQQSMTAQGYADESCWSRGQAWAMYGFAQCALRTGRQDFIDTCRKVSDVFLSKLHSTGVPRWDFNAPEPCPYDASAATIAACGLRMLSVLLQPTDAHAADAYLGRAFRLIEDTLRECGTGAATLDGEGKVQWGEGGWETILSSSTINGNPRSPRRIMDHGLIYADYYLLEFGNEVLKMANK